MLLLGFILSCLSCFIFNVYGQNYLLLNAYNPEDRSSDVYFADRYSDTPRNGPVDDDVLKRIFEAPTQKKHTVEVEKSNELLSTTTIEQGLPVGKKENGIAAQNSTKRPSPNKASQKQTVYKPPTLQLEVPNADKYNSLLYSVTNIGISVLKSLDSSIAGNSVVSPYSISSLLSLLQQGATGSTQEELSVLLNMQPHASAAAYSRLSSDYKSRDSRSILRTASSIFVGDTFNINRDFKQVAQSSFDSDISTVSYVHPDQAALKINKWVAKKTSNKIENLIPPEALDQTTQLVLVNAIYFKGLWEVPFRVESSRTREFHLRNGVSRTTQFMRMRRLFKAGEDPANNAKVVILPFEGNQYSLMIILPSHVRGISELLSTLTDARLLSYLSFPAMDTELEIPKFVVRGDTNLEPVLRKLGVSKIFGHDAGLENLGLSRYSMLPLISSVIHSAVLSIDEQGAKAAAATASAAVALSYDEPSLSFIADSPFLVVLWDTTSALPLFMAKIEDPQQ